MSWWYSQTSRRSISRCSLKNSPSFYSTPTPMGWREARKVIILIDCSCPYTITRVQYLYLEPKHESYSSMTYYNLWYKTFLTWDNLDPNLFLFVESDMSFPTPTIAHRRYLLTSFERADSSAASESADVNPYAIDSLMTQSYKLRVPTFFFTIFGVNTA